MAGGCRAGVSGSFKNWGQPGRGRYFTVWYNERHVWIEFHGGTDVFLGQAAHCASTGGQTDTDGCLAGSLPLGTPGSATPTRRCRKCGC